MIQGFAIAATVIAWLVCLGCGFLAHQAFRDSQGGGDYGSAISDAFGCGLTVVSASAGVIGFVGIIACIFGRSA